MSTKRIEKQIAQILKDEIHFSGQTGNYVIHGAIEKLKGLIQIETTQQGNPVWVKADLKQLLFDVWQLCDGFALDNDTWSEWDESVRTHVKDLYKQMDESPSTENVKREKYEEMKFAFETAKNEREYLEQEIQRLKELLREVYIPDQISWQQFKQTNNI